MAEKTYPLGMIEHPARKSPYQSDYHNFRMAKSINNHHGCQLHPFKSPLLFVKVPLNHHWCWLNSIKSPLLLVKVPSKPIKSNYFSGPMGRGSTGEHPIYVDWANDGKRVGPY
jgi:hypothetical protein